MCGWGERRTRGHLAHLGASGLLIGGDTQLPAIHHRPLRPLDNSNDSALLLSTCNWPHPLSFKVSPLTWEQTWWGCWVTGCRGAGMEMEKARPLVRSLYLRQMYTRQELRLKGRVLWKRALWQPEQSWETVCLHQLEGEKNVTAVLFPFLGQTLLARLFYSR